MKYFMTVFVIIISLVIECTFGAETVQSADLTVTVSDNEDLVFVGGELTYHLTVSNNGLHKASPVLLKDILPQGVCFIAASSGCSEKSGTVMCDLGSIERGRNKTVQIVVSPLSEGTLTNRAVLLSLGAENTGSHNETRVVTTVVEPVVLSDLVLALKEKKGEGRQTVVVGDAVTYTFVVTNSGPDTVTDVTLTDILPENMILISASSDCNHSDSVVNCNLGNLAEGTSAAREIVVTPTIAGTVINTASVTSSTGDSKAFNNRISEKITVLKAAKKADLSLTVKEDNNPVQVDTHLTYTITVSNKGTDTASGIVLTDTLPRDVAFVSASSWCTEKNGRVSCNMHEIAAHDSAHIDIVVTPYSIGTVKNTVTVVSSTGDSLMWNNTVYMETEVKGTAAMADLSVTRSEKNEPLVMGENLTYTLTVTNDGPDSAQHVIVTDNLPENTAFVSASSECKKSEGIVTCELGNLDSYMSKDVTIVVRPQCLGPLVSSAAVSNITEETDFSDNRVITKRIVSSLVAERNSVNGVEKGLR